MLSGGATGLQTKQEFWYNRLQFDVNLRVCTLYGQRNLPSHTHENGAF